MRRYCTGDGWLLLEAALLLAPTRLALIIFPFRRLLHILNRLSVRSSWQSPGLNPVERVGWAIRRASALMPGAQHCLTMAFVAKLLLARHGQPTQLRIGVAKDPTGRLTAHAWLESEGEAIFGVTDTAIEKFSLFPHLDRV